MDFTDLSTVNPAFSTSFTPIKREESLADSISTTSLAHSEAFFSKKSSALFQKQAARLGNYLKRDMEVQSTVPLWRREQTPHTGMEARRNPLLSNRAMCPQPPQQISRYRRDQARQHTCRFRPLGGHRRLTLKRNRVFSPSIRQTHQSGNGDFFWRWNLPT